MLVCSIGLSASSDGYSTYIPTFICSEWENNHGIRSGIICKLRRKIAENPNHLLVSELLIYNLYCLLTILNLIDPMVLH